MKTGEPVGLCLRPSLRISALPIGLLLAASWGPFPVLSGLMAGIGMVALPIFVGFTLRMLYYDLGRRQARLALDLSSAFRSWLIGIIAITTSASVVSIIWPSLAYDAACLVSLMGLGYSVARGDRVKTPELRVTLRTLSLIGALSAGSIIPFWYLRRLAPFPFMLGDDFLVHLVRLDSTVAGVSGVHLYDDGFTATLASTSLLAHSDPLWTFWASPVMLYLAFGVGVYWLTRRVVGNIWVRLASALLPLWFMGDGLVNDLIFFLRPNVILCMVPFAIAITVAGTAKLRDDRGGGLSLIPAAISAATALLYFLDVSEVVYGSFTSHLPRTVQYLIQPGFAITTPAYRFDVPSAVVQDFYAAFIASMLFFVAAMRRSDAQERRLLAFWYLLTCAAVLIEYHIGLLMSLVLLGLLVLRRHSNSRLPAMLSVIALGLIGVFLAGQETAYLYFQTVLQPLAHVLPGISENLLGGLQGRTQFLQQDYGLFFLYLFLLSLVIVSVSTLRRERSTGWLVYVAVVGLFMYFTPFPDSHFFLILVTPFVGITIALAFLTLRPFLDRMERFDHRRAGSTVTISGVRGRSYSPGVMFAVVVCLVLLVSVSNITSVYDSNVSQYRSEFGSSGILSSFNAQDLSAAEWMKGNLPQTTLIVSDPTTVLILAALADMPYTLEGGRITYNGNSPQTNFTLFKESVANLSVPSLIATVDYYRNTDKSIGVDSAQMRVVLVVNNRTSWWVNGLTEYSLASSFKTFSGFAMYSETPFVSSAFNASASYRIYVLSFPAVLLQRKT